MFRIQTWPSSPRFSYFNFFRNDLGYELKVTGRENSIPFLHLSWCSLCAGYWVEEPKATKVSGRSQNTALRVSLHMKCSCSLALTSGAHFSITRRFGSPVSDVRSKRHSLSYSNGCMGGCWTRKLKSGSRGGENQGFPWRNWIFFITRGDLPVGCRLKCFVSVEGMALKRPRYDNLTSK